MKKSALMTALSLGLLAAPLALQAKTLEEAYVESYRGRTDVPAPISVIAPQVAPGYIGTTVELVFIVDEQGRPTDIQARNKADPDLVREVAKAVEKWRFKPMTDAEGKPHATRVLLPVHIVDEPGSSLLVAAN
ncbi:MAG: energy transducer TonB [Verrucomicrobia bacterium]|nr:MAG: energy transducer TonB [Verrucomicrobiota bacterium]